MTLFSGTKAKQEQRLRQPAFANEVKIWGLRYIFPGVQQTEYVSKCFLINERKSFISTLGNSNCIVIIAGRSKSKTISCRIPGARFEISLKDILYVCWFLLVNNANKQGRTRPWSSVWIEYTW